MNCAYKERVQGNVNGILILLTFESEFIIHVCRDIYCETLSLDECIAALELNYTLTVNRNSYVMGESIQS